MDFSLPPDMSHQSSSELPPSIEWESWGEESTINLCEIQLKFEALAMSAYRDKSLFFARFTYPWDPFS